MTAVLAIVTAGLARAARRDVAREKQLLSHTTINLGRDATLYWPPPTSEAPTPSDELSETEQDEQLVEPIPADEDTRAIDFHELWEGAQSRLSTYHELAVIQGRQSFRMLLLFSMLGFALLAFVVWKATEVESTAGGIALGAAGTTGAALTGYIGRTFMRAYQDANGRLVDYFAEPLDMSRLLASERLLGMMSSDSRDEAALRIITSALARQNGNTTPNMPSDPDG